MENLKVSEIQIVPVKPQNGLIAFASCVINDCIYIGNIALYTSFGDNWFRLVYPSKSLANGKQINCVHPITKESGDKILAEIVKAYKTLVEKHGDK